MQQQAKIQPPQTAQRHTIWLWAAGAIILAGVAAAAASYTAREIPQVPVLHLPLKAQVVDRAMAANTSAIAAAFNDFERTRSDIDRRYFERLIDADKTAAKLGASTPALAQTLRLKAMDRIRNEDKASEYLQTRLEPMVDVARQDYRNELASSLTHFEIALDQATVALAFDLAAELPNANAAAISMPSGAVEADAPSSAKLGVVVALGALDAAAVSTIAGKIFWKQIGRLMAIPAIAVSDGPLPVGDLIAIAFAGWTAWDIYHLRSQYQGELLEQLTKGRTAFLEKVAESTNHHASEIRDRAFAARDEIVRKMQFQGVVADRST